MEKIKEAQEVYLKTVTVNPNHMDAWVNLSISSFKAGDYKDAVKYCDEAILLGYEPPKLYLEELEKYRNK